MKSTRFHLYARFVSFCTFVLLIAGGLVTSTGSGLSVPDWPLSYGGLTPPMIGGIRFEHTHRLIAGFVGFLTLGLAIAVWFGEKRRWVRFFALGALFAVALQAVLGGLTVIYLLPDPISISHACLAQTFFCMTLALAYVTSNEWKGSVGLRTEAGAGLKRVAVLTVGLVYLQLILGALVRHTHGAHGIPFHVIMAIVIPIHVLFIVLRTSNDEAAAPKLSKHALWLGVLVLTQIFLGLASFIFTQVLKRPDHLPAGVGEAFFRTTHQSNGAAILGLLVLFTLRAHRLLRAERP